jgi:glucose/mannose-6-phosphate isomerase
MTDSSQSNSKQNDSAQKSDNSQTDFPGFKLTGTEPNVDPDIINSREQIAQIDQQNVLGSIEALADQVRQAWHDTQNIDFDFKSEIRNIVVAGMGGSGLGADVVKHLFKDQLKTPIEVVNDYFLPNYIDQHTLVILSSYSGNTEEVLACSQQAKAAQTQTAVITAGGKLKELAQSQSYPIYLINPEYNPSEQPRMAIGYAVIGLIGLLQQAQIINIPQEEIDQTVQTIIRIMHECRVEAGAEKNPAKTLSFNLVDRQPNLVGAEFMTGALHVIRNQFHENAKTLAEYYQIPEINHHMLEGLELPASNNLDNIFLFFNSKLYYERNQKRIILTQEAVEKQNIQTIAIQLEAESRLSQVFEAITLMAYANFYLAMLHQINPGQIPIVDWFKQQLG